MNNNKQNHKVLSICIPTYNRDAYLNECLQSIVKSREGQENIVDISILDNCSKDDTIKVIEDYKNRYPNIRYLSNEVTIEANNNIYNAARMGQGEYIWIFGDDDKMAPNAIPLVLKLIAKGYNLILCEHLVYSKDFARILHNRFYNFKKDSVITNHDKLMKKIGLKLGFISSVIVRKNQFFSVTERRYKEFIEYGFAFVYAIYSGILKNTNVYLISTPIVLQRGENSAADARLWYRYFAAGSTFVFTELGKEGYSHCAVYTAKNSVLKQYVLHDISYRRRNGENLNGLCGMLFKNFKYQYHLWLICMPVLLLPLSVVIFINKWVNYIKHLLGAY